MQPSSRAIPTHKAAGFILETVADIKSESMAGFSSESLAEIARNQQIKEQGQEIAEMKEWLKKNGRKEGAQ